MLRLIARALGASAVFMALSGCSVFYSETRDNQGKAAKGDWDKVDLTSQISLARKNHAALLADQLKATDEIALAQRALAARQLAVGDEPLATLLLQPINESLRMLVGSDVSADGLNDPMKRSKDFDNSIAITKLWLDDANTKQTAEARLLKTVLEFEQLGLTPKPCKSIGENASLIASSFPDVNGPKRIDLDRRQGIYRLECARLDNLNRAAELQLRVGDLSSAREAVKRAEADYDSAKKDTAPERDAFETALANYNEAASKQEAKSACLDERLTSATLALRGKVRDLNSAGKGFNSAFGTKVLGKAEQDSVDRFLATLAGDPEKTPSANDSHPAAALLIVSEYADEAKAQWVATDKPNLVPLLLAKTLAQAKSDKADREIKIFEIEIALRRQRLQALVQRFETLDGARESLEGQPGVRGRPEGAKPIRLDESTLGAFTPAPPKPASTNAAALAQWDRQVVQKQRAWDAAASYLDDIGRLQPAAQKPLFQIDALAHEQALSAAEANLALWTGIINSVEGQSAAFAAAGIKASDIQALINSAALLWIGKGVN